MPKAYTHLHICQNGAHPGRSKQSQGCPFMLYVILRPPKGATQSGAHPGRPKQSQGCPFMVYVIFAPWGTYMQMQCKRLGGRLLCQVYQTQQCVQLNNCCK